MFDWSRLGPIAAISGAEALQALDLPPGALLVRAQGLSSFLGLLIGSASAKRSACPGRRAYVHAARHFAGNDNGGRPDGR